MCAGHEACFPGAERPSFSRAFLKHLPVFHRPDDMEAKMRTAS